MVDTPPVLLLIFNRPDLTEQVMERIRQAEPPQLFVGADGPRTDCPKDEKHCEQARKVATQVGWDCEVHTLFREENLGCKQAVSTAITWFFDHVEAGIILEDDCVPHPTFFPYCAELLERYKYDRRVMTISGNNFQPNDKEYNHSYYFSAYMHCWGWASWRRAWRYYDGDIPNWSTLKNTGWLQGWLRSEQGAEYWSDIFDTVAQGEIDSWAYPWTFSCWAEHGLTILPEVNLVTNIGFGKRSTHTKNPDDDAASLSVEPIESPLSHPKRVFRDYEADEYTLRNHFGVSDVDSSYWKKIYSNYTPEVIKR
jgi:hypothetical protein